MRTERHVDYDRLRHADLLRRARAGELAAAIAASRDGERRSRVVALQRERRHAMASASA